MPGEFYIKGKKEKTDLSQVLAGITQLEATGDAIKARTDNLAGEAPETRLNDRGLASGRVRHYFIGSG